MNEMTDSGLNFLRDIVKEIGGEYTQLASEIDETETYVDTGSYIFNALVSGSIYGGVSGNKITAIAGETSTGKTFFSLAVVKNFLDTHPDGYCLYFDTESAITKSLLESRGIDTNRLVVVNVVTVEEFRTKTLKAVDIYLKKKEEERKPCIFVLDSLGMLSTNKEINDALAEKDTRDMTKAQLIKGAFRMLTLKLGQAKIPMLVTNHTYDSMSLYGGKQMSGGCLSPGTKIFTRGGYKNIEDITENDFVYTKEGEFMKVLETHNFKEKELLQIEFDDGYKVTCTPEHKFFIDGMWIEAKDLVVDNEVCCI
jgi:RecA/RadA recombinase